MRENSNSGSIPFRNAYLQSLINVIEVDDTQIPIKGSETCSKVPAWPAGTGPIRVRGLITEWRAIRNKTANFLCN